jgi:hypothetical protein
MSELMKTENLVSLYEVERCYGGAEEGGWWYDLWTLIEVVAELPLKHREAAHDLAGILNAAEPATEWNRFSVNGGAERKYIVECERGEYETTETPHYE